MSDRKQEILNEFKLRRLIRKAIRIKEMKRKKSEDQKLYEEKNLRNIIRHLLQEASGPDADGEPSPYGSTPVSALADAFNEILKPIKTGLRKLHEPEERESYRAHILSKFQTIFQTFEGLDVGSPTMVGESDVEIDGPGRDVSIDDDNRVMPSDGSEDERFKDLQIDSIKAVNLDDDTAKLLVTVLTDRKDNDTADDSSLPKLDPLTSILVNEGVDKETFSVQLQTEPTDNVTVRLQRVVNSTLLNNFKFSGQSLLPNQQAWIQDSNSSDNISLDLCLEAGEIL